MALAPEKYKQKQAQLIERTALALDVSRDTASELLSIPRKQSFRINTLRTNDKNVLQQLNTTKLRPFSWIEEGYFIESELNEVRDSPLNTEGAIYIQNAASWLPVVALDAQPGDTVLDMCAAPGGKTSHIAARARNEAVLTANDNSRPRLHKLQRNLERLGVKDVIYTLHDATRLTQHFEAASFDKILLDAPCSGEGMMTLENKKDFESWSVSHIKRLQKLQKKLIVQAWQLLKPGGTLVYSTCTMAPEENEAVIDYLLRHNDDVDVESLGELGLQIPSRVAAVREWNTKQYDARVDEALRLKPSTDIEAFFVIKLKKALS